MSGTTTSTASFAESSTKAWAGLAGDSDYFIAKIDPYEKRIEFFDVLNVYWWQRRRSRRRDSRLTRVEMRRSLALPRRTDFPVTDGSTRTSGSNDATITEISATGSRNFSFSTLFGGSGSEATQVSRRRSPWMAPGVFFSPWTQFRGPDNHHRSISNCLRGRNQRRFSRNFSACGHTKLEILHVSRY